MLWETSGVGSNLLAILHYIAVEGPQLFVQLAEHRCHEDDDPAQQVAFASECDDLIPVESIEV